MAYRGKGRTKMIDIIDLDHCEYSNRHGSYGGQAGFKDGILWDGAYWIIKYPKSTTGMQRVGELAYTTAPLSEYIGSHIYQMLGFETHETILVYRHGKVAVACRDFRKDDELLLELRTIRNAVNEKLVEELEQRFNIESVHIINLEELLLQVRHNDILSGVDGVKERFWGMVVVDAWINNNDRNNGNWGILRRNGIDRLAPVFDNGGSFSGKTPDSILRRWIEKGSIADSALNTITSFEYEGNPLTVRKLFEIVCMRESDFMEALIRIVPEIGKILPEIERMINDIPITYRDALPVCSEERKEVYKQSLRYRYEEILLPAYEKIAT